MGHGPDLQQRKRRSLSKAEMARKQKARDLKKPRRCSAKEAGKREIRRND